MVPGDPSCLQTDPRWSPGSPTGSLGLPRVPSHGIPWAPKGPLPWDPLGSLGSPHLGSIGLPRVPSHGIPWAPKGSPPMGSLGLPRVPSHGAKNQKTELFGGPVWLVMWSFFGDGYLRNYLDRTAHTPRSFREDCSHILSIVDDWKSIF